jgi:predicted phosphoadenosine phosphosulfate sulfurtransferase
MAKIRKAQEVDTNVWDMTMQRINYIFDMFDEIVVSFSGGKDSTAVLNTALIIAEERNRLPLRVVFYDEEAIPFQTEEYVRRVSKDPRIKLEWYCLPLELRNACSRKYPTWYSWDKEDEAKWVRPLPPEAITSHPLIDGVPREKRMGWADFAPHLATGNNTAFLMGIRASESMTRRRAVTMKKIDNFIINFGRGLAKCYPIYDWQTTDVWTAPQKFGWDYNRAYDHMEMLGIGPDQQRCAPPFGEEPLGGLWVFAQAFPDIWDKMIDRAHGVAAAARYARTELYGFGGVPEKPIDSTWPEYIEWLLMKHPMDVRNSAASSVSHLIAMHYERISTPIAEKTKHPLTGISWNRLSSIAMRGDTKGRRTQTTIYLNQGTVEFDRKLAAYNTEIQLVTDQGRLEQLLP